MAEAAKILYSVSGFEPLTHRIQIALTVRGVGGPTVDLVLPVWAPGAYEIRDSSREVERIAARDPSGRELRLERTTKNRWRVHAEGASEIEVRYTVYGHDMVDDGLDATDEHLFLNATRCFPWVDGREAEPVEVELHLPAGWKSYAELPKVVDHPVRYRAPDFEELVDTPIDCGTPVELELRASGIPHRLVFCGGPGNYELHRIEEDVRKVVEAQIRYFDGSPVNSFTFFVHLKDRRDGGLEHRASTSLVVERNSFRPESEYQRFLELVSHEYFHLYNVKRIRPKAFIPFDYRTEVYTRQLWWMEGTTDYVSHLLVRRAGLITPKRYLIGLAELSRRLLLHTGREHQSLEEASFAAWVDYYNKYEETPNQSVDYYLKGHLVSMCLDLEILTRTETKSSLQTVFRLLWREFGSRDRGLAEGELYQVADRATGLELGPFFDSYVRGTTEVDLAHYFGLAGLKFEPAPTPPEDPIRSDPAYLGIDYVNDGGRVRVRGVLDHTPARRAGISPGDEIIALNGARVLHEGFPDALGRIAPGEEFRVDLFRRGVLRAIQVTAGKAPPSKYVIVPDPSASPLQRKVYESWTGSAWEPGTPVTPPS
ncbi:MAG TPA: PDZ domain-containing protein [Thermoplasmata archaeon]|nr:PDZ domain-containing protein [Thermoplasmata archaeon]